MVSGCSEVPRATCTLFWESVWGGWVSGQHQAELVKGQWLGDEDVTQGRSGRAVVCGPHEQFYFFAQPLSTRYMLCAGHCSRNLGPSGNKTDLGSCSRPSALWGLYSSTAMRQGEEGMAVRLQRSRKQAVRQEVEGGWTDKWSRATGVCGGWSGRPRWREVIPGRREKGRAPLVELAWAAG